MKEIVYKPHNYQSVLTDVDIGDVLNTPLNNSVLARNRLAETGIQPYQRMYSEQDATLPENIEIESVEETTRSVATPVQTVSPLKTTGGNSYGLSPTLQGVLDIFDKYGLGYNVTSGRRPGSRTSNGSLSHHDSGNAFDITPKGMTYEDWKERIRNNPEIQEYFRNNKLGILDETTPEMLKKTGGTGAHWHIGPDKIAVNTFREWYGKRGGKLPDIRKYAPGGAIAYLKHIWPNVTKTKSTSNKPSIPLGTPSRPATQQVSGGYRTNYSVPYFESEEDNSGWKSPELSPTQEAETAFNNLNEYWKSEGGQDLDKQDFIRGFDTLRRFGFSKDYTNGILANWFQESKFQPGVTNKSSGAKYIPQFLGARVQEYEKFLRENNLNDGIETAAKYLAELYTNQRRYNEESQKHNDSYERIKEAFRNTVGSDSYEYYLSGKGNYNQNDIDKFNNWLKQEGLENYRFNRRSSFEYLHQPNTFSSNSIRNNITDLSSYPTGEDAVRHFYNWFERGGPEQYHNRGKYFNILNK